MKTLVLLKSYADVCDIHADRVKIALEHIENLMPIEAQKLKHLSAEDLGFLELLTSRFSKLQDAIGQKIFPLLLRALEEDVTNKSLLDCLNKLEKLGYLESVGYWQKLREVRNSLTHEYPDNIDFMVQSLNQVTVQADGLLSYWIQLKNSIAAQFFQK